MIKFNKAAKTTAATKSNAVVSQPKGKSNDRVIAVGDRGTYATQFTVGTLDERLKLGTNAFPSRAALLKDGRHTLFVASGAWVQSSRTAKHFQLLAESDPSLTRIKGVEFTRRIDGETFEGDLLLPPNWQKGQKQPQMVAVVNAPGYEFGRIETKLVSEQGKLPNGETIQPRNRMFVCDAKCFAAPKPVAPAPAPKAAAKPEAKAEVKAPAPKGKVDPSPAKKAAAIAAKAKR